MEFTILTKLIINFSTQEMSSYWQFVSFSIQMHAWKFIFIYFFIFLTAHYVYYQMELEFLFIFFFFVNIKQAYKFIPHFYSWTLCPFLAKFVGKWRKVHNKSKIAYKWLSFQCILSLIFTFLTHFFVYRIISIIGVFYYYKMIKHCLPRRLPSSKKKSKL